MHPLLQTPALGTSWVLWPCTTGSPISRVPWKGDWRSLPSETPRNDGQAGLEGLSLSSCLCRERAWTVEGKGEGRREKGGRGGERKRIGSRKGRGRGRGGERGGGRKPCATRHALLKAKGRRHPSWGPTAGPFWKTSRDSVYFCSLTTEAAL